MADSISKNLLYEPFLGMDCKENDKYVRVEKKEMCKQDCVYILKCCYICIQTLQDITDMGTSVGSFTG